jgi:hypothetical protein
VCKLVSTGQGGAVGGGSGRCGVAGRFGVGRTGGGRAAPIH